MPVHDRVKYVNSHISNLLCASESFHLFLSCSSANNSVKTTISKLSGSNITVCFVPSSFFWSESINYLTQTALDNGFKFFCTLNDDIEITYSALRQSFDEILGNPLQLVSLRQYSSTSSTPFIATCYRGNSLIPYQLSSEILTTKPFELPIPSTTNGCCLLFSEAVLKKIGKFEYKVAPHYYSDTIFQLTAQQHGLTHTLVTASLYQRLEKTYSERLEKRSLFFKASYLYPPAFFKFTLLLSRFSRFPPSTFFYWYLMYIKQVFLHFFKQFLLLSTPK